GGWKDALSPARAPVDALADDGGRVPRSRVPRRRGSVDGGGRQGVDGQGIVGPRVDAAPASAAVRALVGALHGVAREPGRGVQGGGREGGDGQGTGTDARQGVE